MPNSTIHKLIDLDKAARERVEAYQKEKDTLDAFLKNQREMLLKQHTDETKANIDAALAEYDRNIAEKKARLNEEYQAILKDIDRLHKENKAQWIEEMFQACIE